jgi:hypothetical protein
LKPFSLQSLSVYLFFLLVAVVITLPLITNLSTEMIGHSTGDAYEMGHHIWWFKYALQNGLPLFEQPLSGYPDGFSAISLWSNPLQFFPAWLFAFFMPVPSAYNLAILLTMALNGWAMCWVMWQWLCKDDLSICVPAVIAGIIYMAFPTMQGHLFGGHAGLLVAWGAPLYVYALFKLIEQPSRRWFALAVLFFLLTPSGHTLQLIYVLMPITGWFVLSQLFKRDWIGTLRVIGVSLVGSVLLLIFLIPVFSEAFSETYEGEQGFVRFSIDLLGIATPSFGHPVFGQFDITRRVLGVNLPEGYTYIGIVAAILSLIAIVARRAARGWLVVAVIAWILALGPVFKLYDTPLTTTIDGYSATISPPWTFLYGLPGFNLARTPGRFTFTLALAVAVMVGYGADILWQRGQGRRLFAAGGLLFLGVFALWEYQAFFPHPTVPANVPQAIIDLQGDEEVEAVMDVPWGNLLAAKQGMYIQTWHQKPVIAGQVTRRTPVSPAKLSLLEETLDLSLLEDAGVDVMILHKAYASASQRERMDAALGAPYFEDERFALYRVSSTDEGLMVEWQLAGDSGVETQSESYLFTPSPGWMDFSGTLSARGRNASLYLNEKLIYRWSLEGNTPFTVPLPIAARGYHTVTLLVEPPCPQFYDPTLRCRDVRLEGLTLTPLSAGPLYVPTEFERGVELSGVYLPQDLVTDDVLPIRLWWTFEEGINDGDVRFIKVLDANGTPVLELDSAPGSHFPSEQLAERLDLDASGLSGTYAVYVGWYTLPSVERFEVLSDVPGKNDRWVFLGTVTLQ